jgi:hypothetical protein
VARRNATLESMVKMLNISKRALQLIISYGITFLFIYILLHKINLHQLLVSITSIQYQYILLALIMLTLAYFIRGLRWGIMLQALSNEVKIRNCLGPFTLGLAVNNILPFRAGDVMRMFIFRKQNHLSPPKVLGTLILERLLDLLTLLGLFFFTIQWINNNTIPKHLINSLQLLAMLAAFLLLGVILLPKYAHKLICYCKQTNFATHSKICRKILKLAHDFVAAILLIRSTRRLILLIILSIVAWLFEGGVFLIILLC